MLLQVELRFMQLFSDTKLFQFITSLLYPTSSLSVNWKWIRSDHTERKIWFNMVAIGCFLSLVDLIFLGLSLQPPQLAVCSQS